MAKSADAFRTISEVAEWLDTPAHVLRFWESKFTQVKPVKRAGGRRYYRPQDMLLLGGIKKLLHDDGMTIKGVQKLLRESGVKHVSALSQPLSGDEGDIYTPPAAQPAEPAQVLDFPTRDEEEATPPLPPEVETPAEEVQPDPEPAQTDEPAMPVGRDFNLTHDVPPNPGMGTEAEPAFEDDTSQAPEVAPEEPAPEEDSAGFDAEPSLPEPEDTPAPAPEHAASFDDEPEPELEPKADTAKPELPAFLTREPDAPAPIGDDVPPEPVEDDTLDPEPAFEADAAAPPEDTEPHQRPLIVDVPDDPGDYDYIPEGPLSVLADVPRPFKAPELDAIRPLAERLRQHLDESDQS